MDIKRVYDSICLHITEERMLLGDEAMGLEEGLMERFFTEEAGIKELEVSQVEHSFEEPASRILLKGICQWQGAETKLEAVFTQKGERLDIAFRMQASQTGTFDYFKSRSFQAADMLKTYEFPLEEGFYRNFTVSGQVEEGILLGELAEVFLGEDFSFLPPVAFKDMSLLYGEEHWMSIWKTLAKAKSHARLGLTDEISVGELGISTVKGESGEYYGFSMEGSAYLFDVEIPVMLKYGSGGFFIGLHTGEEGLQVPGIAQVAKLAGTDVSCLLPEGFEALGGLRLTEMTLGMDKSLSGIRSFSMGIMTGENWEFPGIAALSLSDVKAGFQVDFEGGGSVFTGHVEGVIHIGALSLSLSARKLGASQGFLFRGCLPAGVEMHFAQVADDLSELLGLGEFHLPIPDLVLTTAIVEFGTQDKSLHFEAGIIYEEENAEEVSLADKLFHIRSVIRIDSKLTGGQKRIFSGDFFGSLYVSGQKFTITFAFGEGMDQTVEGSWSHDPKEKSPLSLINLLKEFGIKEIPEDIEELGIACDSVTLKYEISKKQLTITVVSDKYGTLICMIYEDVKGQKQFLLEVACAPVIDLSSLPVVGTGLHLLDNASIKDICMLAASEDIKEREILKGITLKGTVVAGSSENPFKLEITGGPRETWIAQESGPGKEPESGQETRSGQEPDSVWQPEVGAQQSGLTKWFSIEKSLGIFDFHRIGVTYRQGYLGFVMDASLAANPLKITVLELGAGLQLSQIKPGFFLSGLGASYTTPALSISGAFLHTGEECYEGELDIRAGKWSVTAIGSYREGSLLAYAIAGLPLGGPPAFYVTGLAAGFGYNRDLRVPEIGEINRFPLVEAAFGKVDRSRMLSEMDDYITQSKGQNFLAAGISFTSFEMAKSFLLATVAFGNRLEVALLGLSEMNIPKDAKDPIAHAQLALRAVLSPDEGIFSIQAQLTSESYILSKKCILTGGFAFYLWFGGAHKGDFVITLGGYHGAYKKPAHYPDVPRLGFRWDITNQLRLAGEIYFALTPASIMAGGMLEAVFKSGQLKAWFTARADFLIGWKPFYYDCSLYVGLGASYRMFVLFGYVTFRLEMSAYLHIWGPEFTGVARISWFIISFTIKFGSSDASKKYIEWDEFEGSFLPMQEKKGLSQAGTSAQVTTVRIAQGLRGRVGNMEEGEMVAEPRSLLLAVGSAIPCTRVEVNGKEAYRETREFGVLPMGEDRTLTSVCRIKVTGDKKQAITLADPVIAREDVPSALWGRKENPPVEERTIGGAAVGAELSLMPRNTCTWLPPEGFLDTNKIIVYEKIAKCMVFNNPKPITGPVYPQEKTLETLGNTLMETSVAAVRLAVIEQMCSWGFELDKDIHLEKLAGNCTQSYYEEIKLQSMR